MTQSAGESRMLSDGDLVGGSWFDPDSLFGGYEQSGLGREHGLPGFEAYLETKALGLPTVESAS